MQMVSVCSFCPASFTQHKALDIPPYCEVYPPCVPFYWCVVLFLEENGPQSVYHAPVLDVGIAAHSLQPRLLLLDRFLPQRTCLTLYLLDSSGFPNHSFIPPAFAWALPSLGDECLVLLHLARS